MDQLEDKNSLEKRLVEIASTSHTPLTVSFELTPFCNYNCKMCYLRINPTEIGKYQTIQNKSFWLNIAEQLKALGCLFILLTGGEPFMHPEFKEIYKGIIKKGFIVTINTNSSLLNDELLRLFKEFPPRRINITLYGASKETYQELCANGNGYAKTIEAIHRLKENGIPVKINGTIVKDNIKEIQDIFSLSDQEQAPIEVTSYLFPALRSCKKDGDILTNRVSPQIAAQIEWEAKIHEKKTTKEAFYEFARQITENECVIGEEIKMSCRAGKSSAWINWEGKMTPCVFMEQPSIDLKQDTVKDCWEYISKEVGKLPFFTDCIGCKLKHFCSICYAAAYHEKKATGNLNYLCEMAKEKKRLIHTL